MPISKYNMNYHDDWAWSLAIKGSTNKEIAEAFGISERTFIRWRKKYPTLDEVVLNGKNIADARIEKSLYQRATGYSVTDTEKIVDIDQDGNTKPVRIKNVTKHIPPDTMAIMYWLNNRQRPHWSQKQEISLSNGSSEEDVVIYLPANGRDNVGNE